MNKIPGSKFFKYGSPFLKVPKNQGLGIYVDSHNLYVCDIENKLGQNLKQYPLASINKIISSAKYKEISDFRLSLLSDRYPFLKFEYFEFYDHQSKKIVTIETKNMDPNRWLKLFKYLKKKNQNIEFDENIEKSFIGIKNSVTFFKESKLVKMLVKIAKTVLGSYLKKIIRVLKLMFYALLVFIAIFAILFVLQWIFEGWDSAVATFVRTFR